MTDVESKTPNKRKSLPAKQASGKKVKLDKSLGSKTKTPGKVPSQQQNGGKVGQNKKTPKQDLQNNSGKKQKGKTPPKKIKAFSGTAAIETPKAKDLKRNKDPDSQSGENVVKRKRRNQFYGIKIKAHAGDKDIVKSIDEKLKAIESRGSLTKTAIRKVKLLKRFKRMAEGKPAVHQKRAPHPESNSTKRRERKKKAKQNELSVKPKQQPKVQKKPDVEEESDDDNADNSEDEVKTADPSDEEEGSEEAESSDEVEGSEDEADSGDEVEGSEDEENSDEEDDEFEDECVPQEKVCRSGKTKSELDRAEILKTTNQQAKVGLEDLQKNNTNTKNQKRYVLFVGNIPYGTDKMELAQHFEKCGDVINIRIPTKKKTNEPRGFAFVEVGSERSYQKCLSLHHSILKGRKINVLYTLGGKNKEEKMKKIKAKNCKLHAMRKKGQLVGSKKDSQKRSFRRKKQMNTNSEIQ